MSPEIGIVKDIEIFLGEIIYCLSIGAAYFRITL